MKIEERWIGGRDELRSLYAAEIVRASPDVIFACFGAQLSALSKQTSTIPIVFVGVSDPVVGGFAASFARPGGNITGFTFFESSLVGQWLGALKEIAPAVVRVAIMFNPDTVLQQGAAYRRSFDIAAAAMKVEPIVAAVRSVDEIEAAIVALSQRPGGGLIVMPDTITTVHHQLIVSLAARHRLPTIYQFRPAAAAGGLLSYGPDQIDIFRRSASYIDRILRGENPGELPIQAPTKFELVINLKTAKSLGLEIPPALLARADEVIE